MNEIQIIQGKIFEVRGQRVMLDHDLAMLYGVETRALNQAVKRNQRRFEGDDFMFQLTKDEVEAVRLKSQFVISNNTDKQKLLEDTSNLKSQNVTSTWGGTRKLPYAFTELGVAMLSSVLRSEVAIDINRKIMRAFVAFNHLAVQPMPLNADLTQLRKDFEDLKLDIEDILHDQNDINESTRMQLDNLSMALAELQAKEHRPKARRKIGFIQDDDSHHDL